MNDASVHNLSVERAEDRERRLREASWQNPDLSLMGTGRRPPPHFPLDLMKPFWVDWAKRAAETASAPIDYVAASLLTSVSAIIANSRWPHAGAGWKEPPILWSALVGSPSSGKSPALDTVFEVLADVEEKMAAGFDDEQRKFETDKAMANACRDAWEGAVKTAVKNGERPPSMPPEAMAPEVPVRPRVRVADCTTEKLGGLAASHERGLLLGRDELSGWLGAFDKYGGGGADRAFAIEMYGGRSYFIDRVKSSEPLIVRHLSVSVLGGIQSDKLPMLTGGPDDGLIPRFLWCWPEQDTRFNLARRAPDHSAAKRAFERLLDLRTPVDDTGKPQPMPVQLSPGAEDRLEEFAREMKVLARDACGPFAGTVGKARGHALRLATVFEYLWWCASPDCPEPAVISEEAVLSAASLMEGYFLPMAERVFADASIPADDRKAMAVAKRLRKEGLTRFNARDLRREMGGVVREAAAMDAACDALTEAGLIRPINSAGSGRRPKNFEVNPMIFESEA